MLTLRQFTSANPPSITQLSLHKIPTRTLGVHSWPPMPAGPWRTINELDKFRYDFERYPGWYKVLVHFAVKSGLAKRYIGLMNYQRYGLRFEDTFWETLDVQDALHRLPGEVLSDRDDRIKRGGVVHCNGDILPKENRTTLENDKPYLAYYLDQTITERRDREHFRPR